MKQNTLSKDIYYLQNPAFCSWILWSFCKEYEKSSNKKVGVHILFLVLPLILHEDSREYIMSTRKSLEKLNQKIQRGNQADLIFTFSEKVSAFKNITILAYQMGIRTGMLNFSIYDVSFGSNKVRFPKSHSQKFKDFRIAAVRLARWFSQMNDQQISKILRIEF